MRLDRSRASVSVACVDSPMFMATINIFSDGRTCTPACVRDDRRCGSRALIESFCGCHKNPADDPARRGRPRRVRGYGKRRFPASRKTFTAERERWGQYPYRSRTKRISGRPYTLCEAICVPPITPALVQLGSKADQRPRIAHGIRRSRFPWGSNWRSAYGPRAHGDAHLLAGIFVPLLRGNQNENSYCLFREYSQLDAVGR